ncbi:pirin family protein [Romboutsia sp. 1001713B170131_170501_G6]|uniref:pirin family protein n=1 Tax=Romboutsia sp. 1001713B170131_170501_G6 TaxID=2787108 RepID=UPI0018ABD83B|nr:pirin family protein [Romboutsia sp. 1001713B170131_170501_G6]
MSKLRSIETSFKGAAPHFVGDGFRVSQYFPAGKNLLTRFSPFILLDYNQPHYFEPSEARRGVGAHPHRGFETVTIAYDGKVEHHDNSGNHGVIGPGDVQWMTAGSGVLHKEYHEEQFSKDGGMLHMIQLWVNLPNKYKMTKPKYQPITKENISVYKLSNHEGEIKVIAGEVKGVKGPASTFSKMNIYNVCLKNHGKVILNEPSEFNTGILIINGEMKINNDSIYKENDFILFDNVEGEIILESVSEDSLAIVLSGEPLNEPVIAHGPFVMNTESEIIKAYEDYNSGKFGQLNF